MASTELQDTDSSEYPYLSDLKSWYASVRSFRMDILGDFSGSELFLVEGDSLVRYAIVSAAVRGGEVSMANDWQILHALATVESFLAKLKDRGCRFHVAFFDSHKRISVPPISVISDPKKRTKYLVARECIIEHLRTYTKHQHFERSIFKFSNPTDAEFDEYLHRQRPYFIMCHDHGSSSPPMAAQKVIAASAAEKKRAGEDSTLLLSFIWYVMEKGYSVGLTNEVEFLDSKILTCVLTPAHIEVNRELFVNLAEHVATLAEPPPSFVIDSGLVTQLSGKGLNAVETLNILALANLVHSADTPDDKDGVLKIATAYILHTVLLSRLSLSQRHLANVQCEQGGDIVEGFFEKLGGAFLALFRDEQVTRLIRESEESIGDLVDGRLFWHILATCADEGVAKHFEELPSEIKHHFHFLIATLQSIAGVEIPPLTHQSGLQVTFSPPPSTPKEGLSVLPFSDPVFAPHLASFKLETDSTPINSTRYEKALYETSLSGTAMRKLKRGKTGPAETYKPSEKKKWWQLKGDQMYQADMLRYAMSLAGTGGVGLAPERIITASGNQRKALDSSSAAPLPVASASGKKAVPAKNANAKTPVAKAPVKGGKSSKAAEIIAANAAVKAAKAEKKAPDVWRQFYNSEVQSCRSDRAKVVVLTEFIQRCTDENFSVEARLIKSTFLFNIWREEYCSAKERLREGYEIIALFFSEGARILASPALSKQIKAHLDALFTALGFLPLSLPAGSPTLPSKAITVTPPQVPAANLNTKVGMSLMEFQLRYCGPYMDRNLESREDSRVRFKPDRWQVEVLDALDADKSVFVVAPTSAGKTFIAYYAMEKAIRNSDDDILVYVAPTKALVNQIAAELQARFVKDYPKQPGKTIWAVHTGDYSIYNPQKCQILITVPHILQIMLLSPALASTWTPRVKRIILDEVHCIGSSEDGMIWEQLLVLAPCPIIALSATVGNPKEFHKWLQVTQASLAWKSRADSAEKGEKPKGVEVIMIHHTQRFNHLRTFTHSQETTAGPFEGLEQPKLYTLGLSDLEGSRHFKHLHPVAVLDSRGGMPEDLSLEARDCYTLYKTMEKVQTVEHPLPEKISPEKGWFPEVIKKADVIKWEVELKAILKDWMVDAKSQFLEVVSLLRGKEADVSTTEGKTELNAVESTGESAEGTEALKSIQPQPQKEIDETLDLLAQLHKLNALPALLFSYDRSTCEVLCMSIVKQLVDAEQKYRETSKDWKKKLAEKEIYLKRKEELEKKKTRKIVNKRGTDQDDAKLLKEMDFRGDDEFAAIASFDPADPSEGFTFAGKRNIDKSELEIDLAKLKRAEVGDEFIEGLRRGVGVHHSGLSRPLRESVERLFRKGYLRVVIATGTLSLGINMPCATVVFVTDNVSLTPLNYRQAAGRAGRRGFDLLGNVIFHGVPPERTHRLINSNLPSLMGHFPTSTTLILRLFMLLHGSNNASHAVNVVNSILSQNTLSAASDGEDFHDQVVHHIRFSIEYLRRMNLLGPAGEPTNFAACAAHLFYHEPSNFLFNALMREGVFHAVCAPLSAPGKENVDSELLTQEVNRKLLILMAHLFAREQFRDSDDPESFKSELSTSVIVLPDMPQDAAEVVRKHNLESLNVFTTYAVTYAAQHKQDKPDILPFTQRKIGGAEVPIPGFLRTLPPVQARSSFTALSGHADDFHSIPELMSTCRPDILLEASGVPYLAIDGIRLNAYLLDFLNHGSLVELVSANHLPKSEVWFMLNEFSHVLAAVVVTIKNLIKVGPEGEMRMGNVTVGRGVGEDVLEEVERVAAADVTDTAVASGTPRVSTPVGRKKVAGNWYDEDAGGSTPAPTSSTLPSSRFGAEYDEAGSDDEDDVLAGEGSEDTDRQALLKVLKGFVNLQSEFNDKFRAIFATKKDAARVRRKLDAQRVGRTAEKEKKPRLTWR